MGLLIVAILVVNNLRDIESDRAAGKRTLAVRFGARGARLEYAFCILGAYIIPLFTWVFGLASSWGWLVYLSAPMAWRCTTAIYRDSGHELNQALAGTGRLGLLFAILFSVGIVSAALW